MIGLHARPMETMSRSYYAVHQDASSWHSGKLHNADAESLCKSHYFNQMRKVCANYATLICQVCLLIICREMMLCGVRQGGVLSPFTHCLQRCHQHHQHDVDDDVVPIMSIRPMFSK